MVPAHMRWALTGCVRYKGAPGSGKTRACAFLGILMVGITPRNVLYTAHGNTGPTKKKKNTYQLPFDVHNIGHPTLVAEPYCALGLCFLTGQNA